MSKMLLSVVMGVIDNATAPLKKMSKETNKYGNEIKKVEKAQAENSAAMGMIDTYNQLKAVKQQNNLALKAEVEKLDELKQKSNALQRPSAALTAKLEKQRVKVEKLSLSQNDYKKRMVDIRKALTKTGVKVYKLDSEYERLNQSYQTHGKEITRLQKKYAGMQKWMKVPRGINKALKMPTVEGVKTGAIATTGIVGTMAGFGYVINNTASELDALQRAADDIQMPVAELQAMRLQATQAGAEAEDMDAAIKEMALRWGEMKTLQSGAMNDYFEDTGNRKAYQDLMKAKDASEAYQILLREIAKETDTAKQNFMADEFFGGDSEKMLKVLKGGVNGYKQAKQLLKDTGGPVEPEATKNAQAFSDALGKMRAIIDSLKISALTPIMAELSFIMEDLAQNMKNMDWRNDTIAELREIVKNTFSAFRTLGRGVLFLSNNMASILGVLAGVKLALIGINIIALANPLGPFIIAIGAVIAGAGLLIDYFGGITAVMDKVKSFWDGLWGEDEGRAQALSDATKGLENKEVVTTLTTNEHLTYTEQPHQSTKPTAYQAYTPYTLNTLESDSDSLKAQAKLMKQVKNQNVEVGITTNEVANQTQKFVTEQHYSATYHSSELKEQNQIVNAQVIGVEKVQAQAQLMKDLQNHNVELGVTTNEVLNQSKVLNSEKNYNETHQNTEQLTQNLLLNTQTTGADEVRRQANLMKGMKNRNLELGISTSETKKLTTQEYYSTIYKNNEPPTMQAYNPYVIDMQVKGEEKVMDQAKKMKALQNRNIELGITTKEKVQRSIDSPEQVTWDTSTDYKQNSNQDYQPLGQAGLVKDYQPIRNQVVQSKSEIDLRIRSDNPVTVEKAQSNKATEINLDVGDMGWSY